MTCTCNLTLSTCNTVNGTCQCLPGYKGDTCEEDLDECTDLTSACGENSDCNNTMGGYTCTCHDGYQDTVTNGRNCTGETSL